MQKKPIIILSLALFLLLVISMGIFLQGGEKNKNSHTFFSFNQDQVRAFQINNFTLGIYFELREDRWWMRSIQNDFVKKLKKETGAKITEIDTGFVRADPVKITEALTYFMSLKGLKSISTGKTKPGIFEISEHSLHIILYDIDKRELDRIYIGKHGPDMFSSFIKRSGAQEIYLAPHSLRQFFLLRFEEWQLSTKKENG